MIPIVVCMRFTPAFVTELSFQENLISVKKGWADFFMFEIKPISSYQGFSALGQGKLKLFVQMCARVGRGMLTNLSFEYLAYDIT